jgi:hypothetical protein
MSYKQLANELEVYVIVDKRSGEIHNSRTNPWYNKVGAARNAIRKIAEYHLIAPPGAYNKLGEVQKTLGANYWNTNEYQAACREYDASRVRVEVRANYEIRKATITLTLGEVVANVK